MTVFNVNFAVDDMEGKTVLVFLKPQQPQRNYRIHAWQVLTGLAGSTESFSYEAIIETDVTTIDEADGPIVSGRQGISPGALLQAISPSGISPYLEPAPISLAREKLTPEQCGVINKTNPYMQFDCNWYVNGHPVVTMPNVDSSMTVSFEHLPCFYFMVTAPPKVGQTYIVQNFSDMAQYIPPITATEVDVILTRPYGLWEFDFSAK
ncbi:hypothetical protein ACFFQ5_21985 [Pseudomonas brassicacearum]|uniref:hypothetical protein n=1 Tax=Pseudomonas brassicacearum TaxID=930166 RepID=UPI000578F5A0|nr:hypothetical protein [Pseudomonas brassicacearum]KAB0528569.1 hypothetical protein F7R20_03410 [Pseudomonas brassicacearum subsp. brassicacearum]NJP59212.1 hypothetical protein [Pseudomonas brassicacearum]BFE89572.1 hypothetical protein GCM10020185_01080 [Pseudomonas brassicacearum subsp. brassicacearum]SDP19575.1 hypothetical protein SAMN04490180_0605 [Pseudomonas brassicacearum]